MPQRRGYWNFLVTWLLVFLSGLALAGCSFLPKRPSSPRSIPAPVVEPEPTPVPQPQPEPPKVQPAPPPRPATNTDNGDGAFLKQIAETGAVAFRLGQLAVRRVPNAPAERLGRQLVIDWSQTNQELEDLAAQRNVVLPKTISASDELAFRELEATATVELSSVVTQMAERVSNRCVRLSLAQLRRSADAAVKDFATRALAMSRHHLEQLERFGIESRLAPVSGP